MIPPPVPACLWQAKIQTDYCGNGIFVCHEICFTAADPIQASRREAQVVG